MTTKPATIMVFLASLFLATFAQAQDSLEGAWQVQEVMVSGGENEGTNTDPNLHVLLFTGGHYSRILNFAARPDTGLGPDVTDEQRAAVLRSFRANSGTYEVSGSKLMLHFMLALNPAAVGNTAELEYSIEGDKLMTTATDDEGVETHMTLTRLD